MPPERPPLALLWRAAWHTAVVGALLGAGYGALLFGLIEVSNPSGGESALALLGRTLAGALLGGVLWLIYGALTGLISGLVLGVVLAVAWQGRAPKLGQARRLSLLVGLLPAAWLVLALSGGNLWTPGDFLLVVLPALLVLGLLWFEAGSLVRWQRSAPRLPDEGRVPTPPA